MSFITSFSSKLYLCFVMQCLWPWQNVYKEWRSGPFLIYFLLTIPLLESAPLGLINRKLEGILCRYHNLHYPIFFFWVILNAHKAVIPQIKKKQPDWVRTSETVLTACLIVSIFSRRTDTLHWPADRSEDFSTHATQNPYISSHIIGIYQAKLRSCKDSLVPR